MSPEEEKGKTESDKGVQKNECIENKKGYKKRFS